MTVDVKKTKLPPQAVVLLTVLGLIVFAFGAFFLVVGPQRGKAADLAKEVEATQKQVVDRRVESEGRSKVEPIKIADLFRLAKAMPDQTDMAGLLLQLNGVAADTGISFESITPQPIASQSGYTVVPVQVVFKGNFYNLADFVYRLRNLVGVDGGRLDATGRLFSIDQLDFTEGPNGFPEIQASLTVNAYVYGAGAAAAPAAAPSTSSGTDTTSTTTTTTETTPSTDAATAAQ